MLKCKKVTFQYDGAPKPQLRDVNIKANMSARVAVLGPNGAGKSTLIKVWCASCQCARASQQHIDLAIAMHSPACAAQCSMVTLIPLHVATLPARGKGSSFLKVSLRNA